jgi:hypothetical protein
MHSMARTPITRRWTQEETERLKELLASGTTPLAAAIKLRRRCSSVKRKIFEINNPATKKTPGGRAIPSVRQSAGVVRKVMAHD